MNKVFCKAVAFFLTISMVLGTPQVVIAKGVSGTEEANAYELRINEGDRAGAEGATAEEVTTEEITTEEITIEEATTEETTTEETTTEEATTEEITTEETIEESVSENSVSENTVSENSVSANSVSGNSMTDITQTDAWKLIDTLGAGWNLGNTLDCIDGRNYSSVKAIKAQNDYQLQISYRSNPYTAWDAYGYPYFDGNTGTVSLTWDLSKLKSSKSKACGAMGFQLINHKLGDVGDQKLCVNVKKAVIIQADGTATELVELMGNHELVMDGDVSNWVFEDLTSYADFRKTSDLSDSIFTIEMEITSYPSSASDTYVPSEEYYETLWGNPKASQELFAAVKSAGFSSVRIPVSYADHIDRETGLISQEWLDRVGQVVTYALDQNLYCIVNLHHESSWLTAEPSRLDEEKEELAAVWRQVGDYFGQYDERVIFEGFNEIRDAGGSWDGTTESCEAVNELNQTFVDTVRAQGGNNATRFLALETYAGAVSDTALSEFEIPEDVQTGRLFASVHCYEPREFSWQQEDVSWTNTRSTFTAEDEQNLKTIFESLNQNLVERGIPVLITEYGASNKNNTQERIRYARYIGNLGRQYHIGCFWWDAGGSATTEDGVNNGALFNRSTGDIFFNGLIQAVVNPQEEPKPEEEIFNLTETIRTMVLTGDTAKQDISAEKVTFSQMLNAWYTVIYSEKVAYFTSKNLSIDFTTSGGYIKTLGLKNVTKDFPTKYAALQTATNDLLKQIPENMSDLEKALYVHDYLIYNGEYNMDSYETGQFLDDDHSAYGILVEHKGVCEGYTAAFTLIMSLLDIQTKYIISSSMNHMWNAVEIDGKYYNLDMIYDDPSMDIRGRVDHDFFLCTDQEYLSNQHPHTGFTSGLCTDTSYQNWFMHEVDGRILYQEGYWYYVDQEKSIVKSKLDGTDKSILVNGKDREITAVNLVNGRLVFADGEKIYSCEMNGSKEKLEKETSGNIKYLYVSPENVVYYTGADKVTHKM